MSKQIPIVGVGYTENFFEVDFEDEMQWDKYIVLDPYHTAMYAIELGDDGLSEQGIYQGDYLLFQNYFHDSVRDKLVLIRSEEKYIMRQATNVTPDTSIFTVPGDIYPPIELMSENIRIIGVEVGFIKQHDNLEIININEL
jgi:SOS-response transcriptional repressor LexA